MSNFSEIEPNSTGSLMMEEKSTLISWNDGDSGNEISTRQGCYFLRLPPELLVKIASLLVSKTRLTVLPEDNYSSLIPFSSSPTYISERSASVRGYLVESVPSQTSKGSNSLETRSTFA